jgi:hypothetical protein
MKVSGQPHALAALPHRKIPRYLSNRMIDCTPEPVWRFGEQENLLPLQEKITDILDTV